MFNINQFVIAYEVATTHGSIAPIFPLFSVKMILEGSSKLLLGVAWVHVGHIREDFKRSVLLTRQPKALAI